MSWYLERMEELLTPEDSGLLREVWAPREVAVPPADVWRGLCVAPDGEIRSYGVRGRTADGVAGERVYLASRDCGLSWKLHLVRDDTELGQAVRSPYSGRFLSAVSPRPGIWPKKEGCPAGVFAVRSEEGPSSNRTEWRKIGGYRLGDVRLPLPLRTRKRWVVLSAWHDENGKTAPLVMLSDDDGDTWRSHVLETVPAFETRPPHRGVRWQNGSTEPTIAELSDGTLMMLTRTSQNYHYVYYSYDGGDTWTHPEPSGFHGTLTMPTLFRTGEGALLLFWCNTQPLPELDHTKQWPRLLDREIEGKAEDVFTNRDANHAAVSFDDGKTWRGFREIGLNAIRNDADFRTKGANDDTVDKSVHQFEAVELPYGKILLQYGQHPASRRLVLFDPKWLLETERSEDFRLGLGGLSTQVYVRSVPGNFRGFSGHCAWNRTNGALLVPDPDGNFEEALLFCRIRDERLFSEKQGAAWNFPAARRGEVTVRLRVLAGGLRFSLTDRWFNPVDETVAQDAQYTFALQKEHLPEAEGWTALRLEWDEQAVRVWAGERLLAVRPPRFPMPNGLCYLHLLSLQEEYGPKGTLVKSLQMRAK